MSSQHPKQARPWKRGILIVFGMLAVGIGIGLMFLDENRPSQVVCKWIGTGIMLFAGLFLTCVGAFGNNRFVDKTLRDL